MNKKLLLIMSLLFSFATIFAEQPEPPFPFPPPPAKGPHMKHSNFHGKRMMDEEFDFQLIFVKSTKTPNAVLFELIFTQPINPETVTKESFFINGKNLPVKLIRFSKNYRSINYFIDQNDFSTEDYTFDFEIRNIESIKGHTISPVEFKDFHTDEEYRYLRRENQWKKF